MSHLTNLAFILLTVSLLVLIGIWVSRVSGKRSMKISLGLLILWLCFIMGLSLTGAFHNSGEVPPPMLLIPVMSLITIVFIHRAVISKDILQATPKHWPVAVQTFRIGVELAILGLFLSGRAPIQTTFEGQNFDILVGLTAPLVSLGITRFRLSGRAVIIWNVAGITILVNTIVTILTSAPGPLHVNWPGAPFTELTAWPVIWLPAFLAPFAIATHVFSIRQNVR